MKTKHMFENGVYLIQNFAVNKNRLFQTGKDLSFFKNQLSKYLSPVCDVLFQKFLSDQFHCILKVKSRSEIIEFYKNKYGKKVRDEFYIPPTSYIISQQLSNLQNSYAKKFNKANFREGALFRGRFKRFLMESEVDVIQNIQAIKQIKSQRKWRQKENPGKRKGGSGTRELKSDKFMVKLFIKLRGFFETIPPKCLFPNSHIFFIRKHKSKHLSKPNFN